MTQLSRRGVFGLFGGAAALMASASPTALAWHTSPLNIDYIKAAVLARVNSHFDDDDMVWTPAEIEAHKKRGGWPEYA